MKLLFYLSLLFASCGERQICSISTTSPNIKGDSIFCFENDSVKILYSFWAEKGVMDFAVYNKLAVPLYIDWKKSSLVLNNSKLNYWSDEAIATSTAVGVSAPINQQYRIYGGVTVSNSKISKPERITFIAPKSAIEKSNYSLWNVRPEKLPANVKTTYINKPGTGNIKVRVVEYNSSGSPLQFRNFLTLSTTETFTTEIYIDNAFYLSKITELKTSDFFGSWHYDKTQERDTRDRSYVSRKGFYFVLNVEN